MRARLLIASMVVLQALLIQALVVRGFPLTADDYSYLYQARLFADGRLYAEDPLYDHRHPLNHCIAMNCMRDEAGRRFSKYAVGWPALLSLGTRLHVPWLVQPLLAGLLTFLILGYVHRRLSPAAMKIAALLMLSCIFYAYYGASYRPHLTVALCVFGAFLAYERATQDDRWPTLWIILAGVLLGASATMRYTDWVPLGLWIGYRLWRGHRWGMAVIFAASVGVIASGNLVWNWILSGDPLVAPTHLGGDIGDHDQLRLSWDGITFTAARLGQLCWVFPFVFVVARYWKQAWASLDRTPLLLFAGNILAFSLFSAAVGGPGPRYYFSYFPFLIIATVAIYERFIRNSTPLARRWWHIALAGQLACSTTFIAREVYTMYWRADVARTVAQLSARAPGQRFVELLTGTYRTDVMDLTMNPPDLDSAETLYLWSCQADEIEALRDRFTGREWLTYRFPGQLQPATSEK